VRIGRLVPLYTLAVFAAVCVFFLGCNANSNQTLRDAYKNKFLIGNIMPRSTLDDARFELLTTQYNIATAENAMKPQYLQSLKGKFSFDEADALVERVLAAGMKMHGHTLIWHSQSPGWINYAGIKRDEAIENLEAHVKNVVAHFRGRVISWDVVNEAIADNPPYLADWKPALRSCAWLAAIGPDYIEIAFKAARETDPDAKLYYNDYSLDNQVKALAVYNMVKDINERNPNVGGRPLIDGIGMQAHYSVNTNVDFVKQSLEKFISLGVEVSITELDVQAGTGSKLTDSQAVAQALIIAKLFQVFKENAAHISRVTFWGLDDSTSWKAATSPTLFDKSFNAKPAFYAALNPEKYIKENTTK
jgi:endo-1,4-beta-xylanase